MKSKKEHDFKIKNPFRDVSFYAAIFPILLAIAPTYVRNWIAINKEAMYPLLAWMVMNGWLRRASIQHATEVLKAGKYD